jgi:hypothetical protein
MRVLFHAGMPKTGTSALQNALAALKDDRVDYPNLFRDGQIAHHALARVLLKLSDAEREAALTELEGYLSKPRHTRLVVFSSESLIGLFSKSGKHVAERLCNCEDRSYSAELHVVVREVAGFLEAMYLQSSRFGRIKMRFPDYLATRRDWTVSLFQSLTELHAILGDRLKIALQDEAFNTLTHFESVLGLDRGRLTEISKTQRPSSRFGFRGECLLTHLEAFNAEFGTDFHRAKIVRDLETRKLFASDLRSYTLYDQKIWNETTRMALDAAKRTGFHNYTGTFEELRRKEAPEVVLDYAALHNADKEEALEVLSR